MLAALGPILFEVQPVNLLEVGRDTSASLVEKPVMGRRPPLEFVGDSTESMSLTVKLFPEKFGGLGTVRNLDTMRRSGVAQYFMRGDGVPMGWFCVETVNEKSSHLGASGVGKVVDVTISLKRSDPPGLGDVFKSISGLI